MKFIRRFNLKKLLLSSIIVIVLFSVFNILMTKYYYEKYYLELNNYVTFVIDEVKEEYPNVNEEELINTLNKDHISVDKSLLSKYGINIDTMPTLKSYENIYDSSLKSTIILTISFGFILIILFIIDSYIKNKEIRKITKTLNDVNQGNYDLKIKDNEEGDLSILNDEIYKITLMLREKAEESMKDKNNLKDSIANISHQLKTPLTSMLIMVDNLIENDIDKSKQKDFLNDIRNQIEQMNFLIIALLKLSRLDANVISFKKEEINVKKILFNVNKNVSILSELKKINIHLSGKNETKFIGDYIWELEALTNIIKNCIEHTEENKNIYISFSENHFYTKIIIEDEGNGIPKEELKNIFQRFFKGRNSSSNSIGIGLALAKEIIEKDNGTISVKSDEGKGTTFTIKYFK